MVARCSPDATRTGTGGPVFRDCGGGVRPNSSRRRVTSLWGRARLRSSPTPRRPPACRGPQARLRGGAAAQPLSRAAWRPLCPCSRGRLACGRSCRSGAPSRPSRGRPPTPAATTSRSKRVGAFRRQQRCRPPSASPYEHRGSGAVGSAGCFEGLDHVQPDGVARRILGASCVASCGHGAGSTSPQHTSRPLGASGRRNGAYGRSRARRLQCGAPRERTVGDRQQGLRAEHLDRG